MIALMLQVRPCLTWRDVQHIIVFTATKVSRATGELCVLPELQVLFTGNLVWGYRALNFLSLLNEHREGPDNSSESVRVVSELGVCIPCHPKYVPSHAVESWQGHSLTLRLLLGLKAWLWGKGVEDRLQGRTGLPSSG